MLETDREAVNQTVTFDPLTGAVLTLDEAHEITEGLIDASREYLPRLV